MKRPEIFQHPLIREISIVFLITLVLLYGLVNFIVPENTSEIDRSAVNRALIHQNKDKARVLSAPGSGKASQTSAHSFIKHFHTELRSE
ncbi:hypothetical protein [Oceanospirillum sediminis]|uniref:Uncharacterized protein n=1 Tax=Oceanospirillum sediminis TaxID=2760088 RepID=A0A839IMQ1_9GAMM|nr:hypothetical protein [Oceanospirillum sediminis]MBB1485990.1 hypothetical protein [Oceanospirillum sediminis]